MCNRGSEVGVDGRRPFNMGLLFMYITSFMAIVFMSLGPVKNKEPD